MAESPSRRMHPEGIPILQLSHLVLRYRWPVVIRWIVLAVAGAAATDPASPASQVSSALDVTIDGPSRGAAD